MAEKIVMSNSMIILFECLACRAVFKKPADNPNECPLCGSNLVKIKSRYKVI